MAITPEEIEQSRQAAIRRLVAAARVLAGRPFLASDEEVIGIVRQALDAQRAEEAERQERRAAADRRGAATPPPGSAFARLAAMVRGEQVA